MSHPSGKTKLFEVLIKNGDLEKFDEEDLAQSIALFSNDYGCTAYIQLILTRNNFKKLIEIKGFRIEGINSGVISPTNKKNELVYDKFISFFLQDYPKFEQ